MGDEALSTFVESICGESHLRVEADLGDGFVRLRSAEAERRQAAHDIRATEDIVIEMLRNARDAHARHVFLAVSREGQRRCLAVIDDGDGIPKALCERIFEPRVTSKLDTMRMDKWGVHGRGMALYSIAANATCARVTSSDVGQGAAFLVETDLDALGEKTDQSTFPSFEFGEGGTCSIRGPRNIMRTACEFALECRHDCEVYCGSPTDVAATLYAFGLATLPVSVRTFCPDANAIAACKRLATATDPAAFASIAEAIGLPMSERSARRIMDGTIAPLDSLLERIRAEGFAEARPEPPSDSHAAGQRAKRDARGLKLSSKDASELADRISQAFADMAGRYYLEPDVKVRLRVDKDALHITIPVEKLR